MAIVSLSKPGTLVSARGREWVVLPESTDQLLMVRPVGGLDEEATGILPAVEPVASTTFRLPTAADLGDFASGRLLRDAARLSTRASAGPFRSFGRIAVEPRPYQLVPLIMALKLDPVRLLIADDVGVGKTVEAALIAREMLDRGEIRRLTVLCPPHLAEQWQRELVQKFHIDAELVLSSTIQRLERDLPLGTSVFERYHFTIVSTDFIKSERYAQEFVLKCPEFVIVDEAHGCTLAGGVGKGRQQRYDLLRRIAADPNRHLLLVTATPHSGNEDAFRSLLSLLNAEFANLPTDLERGEREGIRRHLAQHLVQRRRVDIRRYLDTDTVFPERKDRELTYSLSKEYRAFFDDVLNFARGFVSDGDNGEHRRRVRYWSALALLRCVSSSPAAAAATLRSRAAVDQVPEEEVESVGRNTVLDQDNSDEAATSDWSPGSDSEHGADHARTRLLEFARRAEALPARGDHKLQKAFEAVKGLLDEGFQPVVFCRFVDTADYVALQFREMMPAKVRVESVTGMLPPAEREQRIADLAAGSGQYVLVCTDCLSEGINLQDHFNAAFHYDLAWNPTRHEQREGRVDRFGQKKREVRVVTFYGSDNPMDGVILDVLIRRHKQIKSDLGVIVAVPGSSEQVAEALFQGALLRQQTGARPEQMSLPMDELDTTKAALHAEWARAYDREKAVRTRFAQYALKPEAVDAELHSVRAAIGSNEDVARFMQAVLHSANVPAKTTGDPASAITVHIGNETPRALRQALGYDESFAGRFDLPLKEGEIYLGRTSPVIEGLAGWTLDQALDPAARDARPIASRCGVVATAAVKARTTLLVARFRYHLRSGADAMLCEEIVPLACAGPADAPRWLSTEEGESLLQATPGRNLVQTAIDQQLGLLIPALPKLQEALAPIVAQRAEAQLAAHQRVRATSRARGRITIEPVLPVDILGAFVLLPVLN